MSVEAGRKVNHKKHNIWEQSFDWKKCESEAFILQKLDYFHMNPCRGKWNLRACPVDYAHSCAIYYTTGEHGLYEVTNYAVLMAIDLTAEQKYT